MKKWLCVICGLIYDEAKGWPDDGIPPGTRWEDVPDDWLCPDCGVGKADFEMIELSEEEPAAAEQAAPISAVTPAVAAVNDPAAPIVIIGSGYAGYSLAEVLRQDDALRPIILFTQDDGRHYSKPALSNALTRNKTASELVSETALELEARLNIRIHAFCPVERIDAAAKVVHTALGAQPYSKLVLAQGAAPTRLPLTGEGAGDVVSVNDLQDYRWFRERLADKKRVVIIGNGLIGCEFANDLTANGYTVSVIGLSRWPMDPLLPEAAGRKLQQALVASGVEWQLETTVSAVERQSQGYRLSLANGQVVEADLVLSAVGLQPRTELAATAGLKLNRGIVVDDQLRTSNPSIYALGDCAEINGQLLPYIAPINHGVRALAQTLLKQPTPVQYPPMPVIVKTPAHAVTLLPPAPDCKGDWNVSEHAEGVRALFYDRKGRLAGFVLTGELTQERQQWLERCSGTKPSARSVA